MKELLILVSFLSFLSCNDNLQKNREIRKALITVLDSTYVKYYKDSIAVMDEFSRNLNDSILNIKLRNVKGLIFLTDQNIKAFIKQNNYLQFKTLTTVDTIELTKR